MDKIMNKSQKNNLVDYKYVKRNLILIHNLKSEN